MLIRERSMNVRLLLLEKVNIVDCCGRLSLSHTHTHTDTHTLTHTHTHTHTHKHTQTTCILPTSLLPTPTNTTQIRHPIPTRSHHYTRTIPPLLSLHSVPHIQSRIHTSMTLFPTSQSHHKPPPESQPLCWQQSPMYQQSAAPQVGLGPEVTCGAFLEPPSRIFLLLGPSEPRGLICVHGGEERRAEQRRRRRR